MAVAGSVIYQNDINHMYFFFLFSFPEKCECAEVTLNSPKLFCAAEYDYGERCFNRGESLQCKRDSLAALFCLGEYYAHLFFDQRQM